MLVKDVMNKDVKTIGPEATVREAAEAMDSYGVSNLVVVSDSMLSGIITETDLVRKVLAAGLDPVEARVKEVMTKQVVYVRPSLGIKEAAEVMVSRKIKSLPVVEEGRLLGIVTASDICTIEPKMVETVGKLFVLGSSQEHAAG
ncbi:MAG: CBS domain-containing protein [Candidatus Aenigmarchaeota archaeon]|nr:CBS domain-containing protein [Candidatus Aenigmarchaeota archaeon]